jgi:hypothetical protein
VSLGLAAVRQRVDQLAAQVAAGQEQMTRDFTAKLHAVEQDILDRISQPAPPPAAARKPVPPPAQAAPLR